MLLDHTAGQTQALIVKPQAQAKPQFAIAKAQHSQAHAATNTHETWHQILKHDIGFQKRGIGIPKG